MNLHAILENFMHPPVLFFFLGILAVFVKSDLEIPPQIAKFLSIYLLFDIGFKGGDELFHSGFNSTVITVVIVCISASALIPFIVFPILRRKLDVYNSGAIAGTYGSISAVTFATATSFLEANKINFGGYMVAGMALMESPAIISGLTLIRSKIAKESEAEEDSKVKWGPILKEALFNGSVLLLVGSLVIGLLTGNTGEAELKPFISDIFKGMLSLYMLDMGLLAGRRLRELRNSGIFLTVFALCYPIIAGMIGIAISYAVGLQPGDALLQTILIASASYIAVPAAMRLAVPQANMSLLLPMSLGITFTFNIAFGIPLFNAIIHAIW
ncbi:MAG: sodium-dependent bicarbonate transport family permease [Bacteroidetes bacterium]|nr:sodium-dependent bicarbonate transport family permease [Bacteroidota bacterium]